MHGWQGKSSLCLTSQNMWHRELPFLSLLHIHSVIILWSVWNKIFFFYSSRQKDSLQPAKIMNFLIIMKECVEKTKLGVIVSEWTSQDSVQSEYNLQAGWGLLESSRLSVGGQWHYRLFKSTTSEAVRALLILKRTVIFHCWGFTPIRR